MKDQPASTLNDKALARIPGAEPGARIDAWWGLVLAVVGLIGILIIFKPDPYRNILIFVWDGIVVTILITVISFILTLIVGMIGGLGRLSKNRYIYGFFTAYVEIVRGVPLMVQLIWWYYAFPVIVQSLGRQVNISALANYQANPYAMAIMGLVICYAAYMSEIYRAGIQSIPRGQMEAARSQGMSYFQAMRFIILPQALRVILPPVGNEFISLLKDSSLTSVVAVADLTRRGREYMAATFDPLPTWIMVALIYLVMTLLSARIISSLEKRTSFER